MRTKTLLSVLLASLLALLLASARTDASDVDQLLAQIRAEGDKVSHDVFDQLASIGGQDAFEALQKATDLINDEDALYAVYSAFWHFGKDKELAPVALASLEKEAFRDRRLDAQRAATWSLRFFGKAGEVPLERILLEHDDAACREMAVIPLLEVLGERGDAGSAKLILENVGWMGGDAQQRVVSALKACASSKARKLLLEKLKDKKTSPEWRRGLVEVLAEDKQDAVTKAFTKALEAEEEDTALLTLLIDALGERRATRAVRPLKKKLEHGNELVRRAAVLALSSTLGQDRVWLNKLRTFAGEADPVMRLAAVQALSELRAEDSLELIQELLVDPDSRVRSQAVELLAARRNKSSVPVFIARLDEEHGPLRLRIARILRLLTGKDFGFKSVRWNAWWKAEGESFTLPSAQVALDLEFARRKQKAVEGRTQSTFYGLPVMSQNVCFVLDVSGSMSRRVAGEKQTESAPSDENTGPMRIEIAKEELAKVLSSLPKTTYANVVFFEAEAYTWADELVLMTEEVRKEALDFIEESEAGGGTDVHEGLSRAFADSRVDTIYLLTDGSPSEGVIVEPARLRKEIQSWNGVRRVQIHCISVGRESEFLRDLANDTGGDYRVSM